MLERDVQMVQEWAWNTGDEKNTQMLGENEFVVKTLDWCSGAI